MYTIFCLILKCTTFHLPYVFQLVFHFIIAVKPTLPDNYQEKTWEKLQKAVVAIQTSKSIEYSLEELYQAVENMCSHKMDSQLYTKLTALTESHVKLNIKTFFSDTNDKLVRTLIEWVSFHVAFARKAFSNWILF